jgi:hypothetical protein
MSSEDDGKSKALIERDGFDDTEDGVEGAGEQQYDGRVIQGEKLKFSNDSVWLTPDDEEFPADRELCVIDTQRVVQKWVEQVAVETMFVPLQSKWRDLDKLNAACPKTEWRKDFNGNSVGPWQRSRVAYFIDLNTMEKFTWPSSTVGGDICIREFRDRVAMMRKLRGARVFAIVTLSDRFMNTKFGGRQRPDLKIARWIMMGPDGQALPVPTAPALPPTASTKATLDDFAKQDKPATDAAGLQTVAEPSLSEMMDGDSVPW